MKICVAYEIDGKIVKEFPASISELEKCKPVYIELDGWEEIERSEWREIARKDFEALPKNAKTYVQKIRELVDLPITIISVGPDREETIVWKA